MKKILFLLLLTYSSYAQEVALIHINAEFNADNDWTEIYDVERAKLLNGYIDHKPVLKDGYNIRYIPTLLLFKNGQEVYRWEAGLDMKLHVRLEEVQNKIDSL